MSRTGRSPSTTVALYLPHREQGAAPPSNRALSVADDETSPRVPERYAGAIRRTSTGDPRLQQGWPAWLLHLRQDERDHGLAQGLEAGGLEHNGWDGESRVTRVEFRYKRECLKEMCSRRGLRLPRPDCGVVGRTPPSCGCGAQFPTLIPTVPAGYCLTPGRLSSARPSSAWNASGKAAQNSGRPQADLPDDGGLLLDRQRAPHPCPCPAAMTGRTSSFGSGTGSKATSTRRA